MKRTAHRFALVVLSCLSLSLVACSGESADNANAKDSQAGSRADATSTVAPKDEPPGVIARVGDQLITFNDINTMINSSPIVGLSLPELGSPERDTVRITLLDKMISANLLYDFSN